MIHAASVLRRVLIAAVAICCPVPAALIGQELTVRVGFHVRSEAHPKPNAAEPRSITAACIGIGDASPKNPLGDRTALLPSLPPRFLCDAGDLETQQLQLRHPAPIVWVDDWFTTRGAIEAKLHGEDGRVLATLTTANRTYVAASANDFVRWISATAQTKTTPPHRNAGGFMDLKVIMMMGLSLRAVDWERPRVSGTAPQVIVDGGWAIYELTGGSVYLDDHLRLEGIEATEQTPNNPSGQPPRFTRHQGQQRRFITSNSRWKETGSPCEHRASWEADVEWSWNNRPDVKAKTKEVSLGNVDILGYYGVNKADLETKSVGYMVAGLNETRGRTDLRLLNGIVAVVQTADGRWRFEGRLRNDFSAYHQVEQLQTSQFYQMLLAEETFHEQQQFELLTHPSWQGRAGAFADRMNREIAATFGTPFQLTDVEQRWEAVSRFLLSEEARLIGRYVATRCALEREAKTHAQSSHLLVMACAYEECP